MTELVLLAVTRMQSGVCIGGTRPLSTGLPPRWVRPVKLFGTLMPDDIRFPHGGLMRPWDIVALQLGRAEHAQPADEAVPIQVLLQHDQTRRAAEPV